MTARRRADQLLAVARRPREVVRDLRSRLVTLDRRVQAIEREVVLARERQAAELEALRRLVGALRTDETALRERLSAVRADPSYDAPFTAADPLVSVVVVGTGPAVDAALAQAHRPLEVIVVPRDGHGTVTDSRVTTVVVVDEADGRADPRRRWLEAGSHARNAGVRQATGAWVTTLRGDDVPSPDHVTRLLGAARSARAEVAYGQLEATLPSGAVVRLGAGPPASGNFAWGAALFHRALAGWDMDPFDALLDVDAEWGLCRRMIAAGVRFTEVDAVVGRAAPDRILAPPLIDC